MTPLPAPVKVVTVADTFSPSLLAIARRCALRAILAASDEEIPRLPTSPAAERGTVFHKLLERAANGSIQVAGDPWKSLEAELDALLHDARSRLSNRQDTRHFADLSRTLPQVEWHNTIQDVLSAANRLLVWGNRPKGSANAPSQQKGDFRNLVGPGRWTEVRVESRALRISGRVDVFERDPSGRVVIYDYKTGRVLDEEGGLLEHITLQLRLYAVVVQDAEPRSELELVVSHGEREDRVVADEAALDEIREWLERLFADLPAGATIEAEPLARPGSDCRTCPYRHVCSAYQVTAPRYWKESPEDLVWPLDTWGSVLSVERRGDLFAVDLEDAAGRRVRVHRLDARHGELSKGTKGQRAWFFGLRSTRSLVSNGRRFHPLNMYELPSETTQPRAWSLAVFSSQ